MSKDGLPRESSILVLAVAYHDENLVICWLNCHTGDEDLFHTSSGGPSGTLFREW